MPSFATVRYATAAPSLVGLFLATHAGGAVAQSTPERIVIRASRLINGQSAQPRTSQGILIEGERILRTGPWAEIQTAAGTTRVIDLDGRTVLPGPEDGSLHSWVNYIDEKLNRSLRRRGARRHLAQDEGTGLRRFADIIATTGNPLATTTQPP